MANPQFYGLRPYIVQGNGHGLSIPKRVASGYTVTLNGTACGIGIGDPVKLVSDGTVGICEAGQDVFGVVVGVKQYWDGTYLTTGSYVPSASGAYSTNYSRETVVEVCPVNGALFIGLTDETSSSYDTYAEFRAFEGENVSIIQLGTGGRATTLIDISTHATTNTLVWTIVGVPGPDSQVDFASPYVPLILQANLMQSGGLDAILGV